MNRNSKIEIYSTSVCTYCKQAKALITAKGGGYTEYLIDHLPSAREELFKRVPDAKTVPQIFIDGTHVGGYTELKALFEQ